MQIVISSYYNIRFFSPNMIPIATSGDWPYWLRKNKPKLYLDEHNVIIGIKEELFSNFGERFEQLEEKCQKDCPYKDKVPNCQFMITYYKYLCEQDFNSLLKEFERVAQETKKINHYEGEPIIVLMVFESEKCNCAERPCIKHWFKDHGYDLKEWSKSLLESEVF